MKEDIFSGKWHQFKGKVKEKWGHLTDNDLTRIDGKRERLLGVLQEKYGWEQQRAEDELRRFEKDCNGGCCGKGGHSKEWEKKGNHSHDLYKGEDGDDNHGKFKKRKAG